MVKTPVRTTRAQKPQIFEFQIFELLGCDVFGTGVSRECRTEEVGLGGLAHVVRGLEPRQHLHLEKGEFLGLEQHSLVRGAPTLHEPSQCRPISISVIIRSA